MESLPLSSLTSSVMTGSLKYFALPFNIDQKESLTFEFLHFDLSGGVAAVGDEDVTGDEGSRVGA
jgi:hypothetical protein